MSPPVLWRDQPVIECHPKNQYYATYVFHATKMFQLWIRFHPLFCSFMNADFDGDTIGVYYPLTQEAQKEAKDRMTINRNFWGIFFI